MDDFIAGRLGTGAMMATLARILHREKVPTKEQKTPGKFG